MLVPLVVALWSDANFGGVKRTLVDDANLETFDFDEVPLAIGIHQGPSYAEWLTFSPTVTFFNRDRSASMTLGAGGYPNLKGWAQKISSVQFNLNGPVGLHGVDPTNGQALILFPMPVSPISWIPLILDLWTEYSPGQDNFPPGTRLTLVESSQSLTGDFGGQFNDSARALKVRRGPNYSGYDVARLCRSDGYTEGYVEYGPDEVYLPTEFGPSGPWTSSVLFTQPPRHPLSRPTTVVHPLPTT